MNYTVGHSSLYFHRYTKDLASQSWKLMLANAP